MDDQGIATAILSISTPGVHLGDGTDAATMARTVNEFGAGWRRPIPAGSGCSPHSPCPTWTPPCPKRRTPSTNWPPTGVILLANSHGLYLGDPALAPLMATLDDRSAVVLVHPADLPGPPRRASRRSPPTSCPTPPAPLPAHQVHP
ncbi:hypothetical protein [Nonomuraea jiangxiensis]|uniref:hypothetical protein n=1 Tax=Nonomuraea jiangxiensis TaxID=633440 RepID=UPI001FE37F98|nr:hypothetical protein [Nonomuraea jiangxiensis]